MRVFHWGCVAYHEALSRQKALVREVIDGAEPVIVTCEHPKTITLGRAFNEKNIFLSREDLIRQGFDVVLVDRGGDVTLHAPGQLIVYPVIDLRNEGRDLGIYLRKLEQACVDFLKDFGIVARGDNARRGVWVGHEKIASIGIGVSHWVTYHGIGVNVATDIDFFKLIRPCGLDVKMTSIQLLNGNSPAMGKAASSFARHCIKVFS